MNRWINLKDLAKEEVFVPKPSGGNRHNTDKVVQLRGNDPDIDPGSGPHVEDGAKPNGKWTKDLFTAAQLQKMTFPPMKFVLPGL